LEGTLNIVLYSGASGKSYTYAGHYPAFSFCGDDYFIFANMKYIKSNPLVAIIMFLRCGLCYDLAVLFSLSFWIVFNASFVLFKQSGERCCYFQ